MKNKKRAAKTLTSFSGNKNINSKLSVHHINTPFRIGQAILPKLTGLYSENQGGQNQCFHCENWFDWLPFGAVNLDCLRGSYVGICKGCINSLCILTPGLQKRFWQKVERNLKNILGVNAE